MGRTTIKQIAQAAGVSTAAASFALNDKPGVSEETKQRVLAAAKELNYFIDENARSLKTKKSGYLGLIVTDIRNPFFAGIVHEFNRYAEQMGYRVMLGISNDSVKKEAEYIRMFVAKGVEGIAIVPSIENGKSPTHLEPLEKLGIPFVFCSTFYEGVKANCVMTDLRDGQKQMIRYLLGQGMKKIFLLTAPKSLALSRLRIEGFKQAYVEAGETFEEDWIVEIFPNFEQGYAITEQLWRLRPDAIATINDFMAMGVLKALQDMGAKVPYDISVAGYDDLLYSSLLETPLSTVKQPVEEMCRHSVDLLLEHIQSEKTDEQKTLLLPPVLKIRNSTR